MVFDWDFILNYFWILLFIIWTGQIRSYNLQVLHLKHEISVLYNNHQMDSNPKVFLHDGNQMPLIGLGTLNFKPNDKTFNLNDFLMKAANLGYTHFDIKNNEQALGDAFKLVFDAKKQLEDEDG